MTDEQLHKLEIALSRATVVRLQQSENRYTCGNQVPPSFSATLGLVPGVMCVALTGIDLTLPRGGDPVTRLTST